MCERSKTLRETLPQDAKPAGGCMVPLLKVPRLGPAAASWAQPPSALGGGKLTVRYRCCMMCGTLFGNCR